MKQDAALLRYPGIIPYFIQFILLLPGLVTVFLSTAIPFLLTLPERVFSAIVEKITGGGFTRTWQAFMQSDEGRQLHAARINAMRYTAYHCAIKANSVLSEAQKEALYSKFIESDEETFLSTINATNREMGIPIPTISSEKIDEELAFNRYYGFDRLVYTSQALWNAASDGSNGIARRIAYGFSMLLILPVLAIYNLASNIAAATSYAVAIACTAAIMAIKVIVLLPITLMDAVNKHRSTAAAAATGMETSYRDHSDMDAPGRNSPFTRLEGSNPTTAVAAAPPTSRALLTKPAGAAGSIPTDEAEPTVFGLGQ